MSATPARYAGPACPHCRQPLEPLGRLLSGTQFCGHCFRSFEAVVFQPVLPEVKVPEVAAAGPQEAASCAAHRRNAAITSCERCGIFMCALCRIEADGLVICAACFERMATEGSLHSAQTRFRDYTSLAWVAVVMGLLWFPGIVTGPLAVYYAVRGLRQMAQWGDIGGRGRAVWAVVFGVITTITGALFLGAIFS